MAQVGCDSTAELIKASHHWKLWRETALAGLDPQKISKYQSLFANTSRRYLNTFDEHEFAPFPFLQHLVIKARPTKHK